MSSGLELRVLRDPALFAVLAVLVLIVKTLVKTQWLFCFSAVLKCRPSLWVRWPSLIYFAVNTILWKHSISLLLPKKHFKDMMAPGPALWSWSFKCIALSATAPQLVLLFYIYTAENEIWMLPATTIFIKRRI